MPKTMTPDPHNLDLMFFPFLSPPPPGVDPAAAAPQVVVTEAGADEAPASFSIQRSPPVPGISHNSGEDDLQVTADCAGGDAAARTDVLQTVGATVSARCEHFGPPAGYVLHPQADIDRMLALIAQLQNEREADRIDHADYERLLEKERVEMLTPPPIFLRSR